MMYELMFGESTAVDIRRILTEQVDDAIALLIEPTDDRDKSIHEARKGLKRIRAALRLIRDELGPEIFQFENGWYRDVARLLAPLRDSAVLVEALDSLVAVDGGNLPPPMVDAIRQELVDQQMRIRYEMLEQSDTAEIAANQLVLGRGRIAGLPIRHTDFRAYAGGLRRVYRRGARRMALAFADSDPEMVHNWRKRVKYLWHHLEILYPIAPWRFDNEIREVRYIAKLLGDAHDLVVLNETVLASPLPGWTSAEIDELIQLSEARRCALEVAAWPYGLRVYAESPASFVNRLATYFDVWQALGIAGVPPAPEPIAVESLTTAEVAEKLGVSVSAVRRQIHQGQIAAQKMGNIWIIPASAL